MSKYIQKKEEDSCDKIGRSVLLEITYKKHYVDQIPEPVKLTIDKFDCNDQEVCDYIKENGSINSCPVYKKYTKQTPRNT